MLSYKGSLDGQGHQFGLVVARFNSLLTERLLEGALEALRSSRVRDEDLEVAWVPGSFEIPLVAKKMADSNRYDAVICLGVVIRGETAHFDFVAGRAASGILQTSLSSGIPVIFSVLTTETREQAQARTRTKESNAGFKGAMAAIEMVNLLTILPVT